MGIKWKNKKVLILIFLGFFFSVLEFELRASHWLGRCCTMSHSTSLWDFEGLKILVEQRQMASLSNKQGSPWAWLSERVISLKNLRCIMVMLLSALHFLVLEIVFW
jgi:hypothetical protein